MSHTVTTPKQRKIAQRRQKILSLAQPMLLSGGLEAIRMDEIAKQIGQAKGTVYNDFCNKEEIALALAVQAVETRFALFDAAAKMSGRPRQRCQAIGLACEVFVSQFPAHFSAECVIRHDAILAKTSAQRRDLLRSCEGRCVMTIGGIVRDAIAVGDLTLPAPKDTGGLSYRHGVEPIIFGLWSLVYGGLLLESTSPSLASIGIANPRLTIRRNCHAMMDGIRWKPLYNAQRDDAFAETAYAELDQFADTLREAQND